MANTTSRSPTSASSIPIQDAGTTKPPRETYPAHVIVSASSPRKAHQTTTLSVRSKHQEPFPYPSELGLSSSSRPPRNFPLWRPTIPPRPFQSRRSTGNLTHDSVYILTLPALN